MPIRRLEIGLDAKDLKNCFWQLWLDTVL
jgi:hypothetical protein